ncbi:MAG: chromate efflux transporter [Pseudomonadota bacterium]
MSQPDDLPAERAPVWLWLKLGLMSFGGPAAHISLIQSEICERRKLATYDTYLRGLNFAVLLPGPEALQLATYLGWRISGIPGALLAGAGFVLPGAILMITATLWIATKGDAPLIKAVFAGVQPVIVAFVTAALFKLARNHLRSKLALGLAVFALVAMMLFSGVFPLVILIAGALGALLLADGHDYYEINPQADDTPAGRKRTVIIVLGVGSVIWLALTALCIFVLPFNPYMGIDIVMSTAAMATFGGAYPAVAFVGEQAVTTWGWLSRTEMIDGLALAETIPGPLSLFNAYVGTMAAIGHGVWGAVLGGALAVSFSFLPSLTLVIAFAPYVDWFYSISLVRAALAGVSAAVVGIIGKLALVLIYAVCLPGNVPDWTNIAIAFLAAVAIMSGRVPPLLLIVAGAVFGVLFLR